MFVVAFALPLSARAQHVPPHVDALLKQIKAADKDQLAVSEEDGRFLRLLVVTRGAKRALEIGAASGYSAIWMGLGMRETGGKLIVANATGCLEVFSTPHPESSWRVAWLHSLFGNAPAVGTGIAAAMKVKGKTDTRVIAQGGDGGTVDIGFGCLSGMFERNDDVLYVCYDNEAYMNTGVQRSSATPPAARTATTPAAGDEPGNVFGQGKSVPLIAMAHGIPYVGTASVADLRDLEYKVSRAMSFHGARYIHVHVPCPLGWGSPIDSTIRVARAAVESGLFPIFEAEYGEIVGRRTIRKRVPVDEYLREQGRFGHLFKPKPDTHRIGLIQAIADRNIERFGLLNGEAAHA